MDISGASGTAGIGSLNFGVGGRMKSLPKPMSASKVGGIIKPTAILSASTTPSSKSVVNAVSPVETSMQTSDQTKGFFTSEAGLKPGTAPTMAEAVSMGAPSGTMVRSGGIFGLTDKPTSNLNPMGDYEAQHPVYGTLITGDETGIKMQQEGSAKWAAKNPREVAIQRGEKVYDSLMDNDPAFFQDPSNKYYNDAETWKKAGMDMITRKPIVATVAPPATLGIGAKPQLTPLWEDGPTDPDKMTSAEIQRYLTLQSQLQATNAAAAQSVVKKL